MVSDIEIEESRVVQRGDDDLSKVKVYKYDEHGHIICQHCGNPILKEQLSTNKFTARKELKWQMHRACVAELHKRIDMEVPGLIAERSTRKSNTQTTKSKVKPKSFTEMKSKFKR